jgi:hypothetical protein
MSLVIEKSGGAVPGGDVAWAERVACVSAICLLASAPLLAAIALMIWAG